MEEITLTLEGQRKTEWLIMDIPEPEYERTYGYGENYE